MRASHTGQKVDTVSGSPAHSGATSGNSSLDIKSEKTVVEHCEKAITLPPPSALRPGLWRRIWDRLSGSKDKTPIRSKGSLPPPHQPKKTPPSPTPAPTYQEWAKVEDRSTVRKGLIPHGHQFKYAAQRSYCPVEHVTLKSIESAPWFIETTLFSQTVADVVCAPPRWPEHLHQCWYDKIYVKYHPMITNQTTYGRSILLSHRSPDGLYDWAVKFAICHKDAKQLAALTYSDMRDMLLRRSLIKTTCWRYDSDDPLVKGKSFYLHIRKPGSYKPWFPSLTDDSDGVPSEESLREVVDIEDLILWEKFDNHHSKSEDWPSWLL